MPETHTRRVDLNLLPALDALLNERHVSKAAARVQMSQPAMSRALQRLRRHFNDALLVRGPSGYSLTPRGESIRCDLAVALPPLEKLFATDSFDVAVASRHYRVAMSDNTFPMFGPVLARTIITEAPSSTISFSSVDPQVFNKLDAGAMDLVLYGRAAPEGYSSEQLFTDRFVCVVGADHALAGRESLPLALYAEWPHLAIDIGQADIDEALRANGYSRRVVVTTPYHALATSALPGTDLILTVSSRLAARLGTSETTRTLDAPRELGSLQFISVWHPRLNNDPSLRWLRQIIRSAAANTG